MPYDKNRGRAAGTPGFYSNVNKKYSHPENTGEWTRGGHAHSAGEAGGRTYGRRAEANAPRTSGADARTYGRPDNQRAYGRGQYAAPRTGWGIAERGGMDGARPRRDMGTRSRAVSADRPIYQNAFAVKDNPAPAENADAVASEELMDNLVVGRNPIREAVKSGRELERILVQRGELSGSAREIIARARESHIVIQEVDKARLDAIYPNHQGMIAYASAANYSTVEDILAYAQEKNEAPFIIVLDGITDPHNLGAIIRTAECAGAHGVIIQQRRSVGLTPAAVKAAAGATEYMRVARVVNITRTLSELKRRNIWVVGADMDGRKLSDADLTGPMALVVGAEGEGISRLVKAECDLTVALPMRGKIQSLNASVAAGILMYAVRAARPD